MKTRLLIIVFILLLPVAVYAGDYIIGEGDALQISVWGEEQLSVSVRVRPDGRITIPALGEVTAAGLTPNELQALLSKKLTKFVKNPPVVTVIVAEITNNKVFVFGGGVTPGVYNLDRRTTLLELLCQVSDVKSADLKRAYVLRNGKKIKEDFHRLFVDGTISEDMVIEPNDVIFFPALDERNVYVVGAVNKPMFIKYREGLTAMAAILEAGGFSKFAKQNDIIVYRKGENEEIEIPLKIKKLINDGDLEQNVKLRPGDYIVVREGMF